MGYQNLQHSRSAVAALAQRQHGVATRAQLLDRGLHPQAIKHRISTGLLHPVWRGVYAVGRPELSRLGRWMAAVLSCGPDAVLSYESAAQLWGIRPARGRRTEVSVPAGTVRRRPGITVHRRSLRPQDVTRCRGIPVTTPVCTLIDLATRLGRDSLEAAINEADKQDLVDPDELRSALDGIPPRRGAPFLRSTLDRRTFTPTDTKLERLFLPIARSVGLPLPQTQVYVNGFRVDFYWPELGLVVETDGLRYHRTPAEQARDRVRDQVHAASGLTPVRFTRAQVRYEPGHVRVILAAMAGRLGATRAR
jgi:very-short-patch-repair endonuclease